MGDTTEDQPGSQNGESSTSQENTDANNLAASSSSLMEQDDGVSTTNNDVEISCSVSKNVNPESSEESPSNEVQNHNDCTSTSSPEVASNSAGSHQQEEEPSSSTSDNSEPEASVKKLKQGDSSEEEMSTSAAPSAVEAEPEIELKVIFNKIPIPVNISLKKTVGDLKKILEKSTNVTQALMKVLVKGNAKDDVTLESLGLTNGSKVLVIGTPLSDVMKVTQKPTEKELQDYEASSSSTNESKTWCQIPRHQKIVEKGIPDDAMPGISNCHDELPPFPLHGMVSSKGSKVRLTFKLETDELWIGTKERTEKVAIGSIKAVLSQSITGYEHYHIMAIQLGPTEASRFFIYWVPAQYVEAIKNALSS